MRILGSTTGWESQIHYFSRPSFPRLALFAAIIVPSLCLCCTIHQCQGFLDEAYFSHQDSGILTKAPRAPSQFHLKDSLILISSFHIQATCRPCCCSISCLFSFHVFVFTLFCSHAGLCDALVILEGLVVVELPLVPLVVLLPLQHRQQALKRAV